MRLPKGSIKLRLAAAKLWEKWRLALIGGLVLVLIVIGISFALGSMRDRAERQREALLEGQVQGLVDALNTGVGAQLKDIEELADRSRLAALFAAGDADGLRDEAEALAARSPLILKVRMLAPGTRQVDYDSEPPLTYASIRLLERSESEGRAPAPDAQLLGGPQGHIAYLVRVDGPAGELVGHLLFALDPKLVQSILDAVAFAGGYAEVSQIVAKAPPVVLARRGVADGGHARVHMLRGTDWRIRYTPPSAASAGWGSGAMLSLVGALLLGAAGGALWWLRRTKVARGPARPDFGGAIGGMRSSADKPVAEMVGAYLERAEDTPSRESAGAVDAAEPAPEVSGDEEAATGGMSARIFRAYDIRGIVNLDLNPEVAERIGLAIGSEAYERGQQTIVVARDGRLTSPELAKALISGLRASGRDVIDVGQVPTPVLYFAAHYLETNSGVMVTGSHNPADYNGFKVMLGGETLSGEAIDAIRQRLENGQLLAGEGGLQSMDVGAEYIRRVSEDIPVALGSAYKVVVDCGNGVAGDLAPRLYRALGHDVIDLYCTVDGRFPNHHPDPIDPGNLTDLIRTVREEKADLGFAFDGDGDRLGVVDGEGNIVWADRLLMLFAQDILSRNPGAQVVFDVKCSRRLGKLIKDQGGKPIIWKSGHSLIKQKMRETGALLGGEFTGHIFIHERWYGFDDALYAGARLLEVLQNMGGSPAESFHAFTTGVTTPELRVDLAEGEPLRFMRKLGDGAALAQGGKATTLDGIRVDYPDGWGLVRASNTTPSLVLRFEGNDDAAVRRIQALFRQGLLAVQPDLALPF